MTNQDPAAITTEEALRTVIMVAIGDLRAFGWTVTVGIADTLEQALRDNEPGEDETAEWREFAETLIIQRDHLQAIVNKEPHSRKIAATLDEHRRAYREAKRICEGQGWDWTDNLDLGDIIEKRIGRMIR